MIIITVEELHFIKKKRRAANHMTINIDMGKVYALLHWCFVRDTHMMMWLIIHFIKIAMYCVSKAKLPILWSGSMCKVVSSSWGISQEELSPDILVRYRETKTFD